MIVYHICALPGASVFDTNVKPVSGKQLAKFRDPSGPHVSFWSFQHPKRQTSESDANHLSLERGNAWQLQALLSKGQPPLSPGLD